MRLLPLMGRLALLAALLVPGAAVAAFTQNAPGRQPAALTPRAYLPFVEYPSWITLVNETFEGPWPGPWQLVDTKTKGDYRWAPRDCLAFEGSRSGWAVGGGGVGQTLACGSNYPDDAETWMVYGPFSLVGATAADLSFKLWLNSQVVPGVLYDDVCRLASIDTDPSNGQDFWGRCSQGDSAGWVDLRLDLADVDNLGNLLGSPQVWVALVFQTDASVNLPVGAYVDNIVLRQCMSATCPAVESAAQGAPGLLDRAARRTVWPLSQ